MLELLQEKNKYNDTAFDLSSDGLYYECDGDVPLNIDPMSIPFDGLCITAIAIIKLYIVNGLKTLDDLRKK